MASPFHVALAAAAALLVWSCIGLAVASRLLPRPLALPAAPLLGWALHSAVALPVLSWAGFSAQTVWLSAGIAVAAALAALWTRVGADRRDPAEPTAPPWPYALAALVAGLIAVAILPKTTDHGVILAPPIFDHAKVAMVDAMARFGLPPVNPFFGAAGAPSRLVYYYLLHFSAAELVLALGVSGWEADAALTWFAAFSSLCMMLGLAVWFGRRTSAATWLLLVSLTTSARPLLTMLVSVETQDRIFSNVPGLSGWFYQAPWVPQHIVSAACVLLAICLMAELPRRGGLLLPASLALTVAAAFESSTWIGGVAFAVAAPLVGAVILATIPAAQRGPFARRAALAAVLALAVAFPMIREQVAATGLRSGGAPITLMPFPIFGELVPAPIRRLLDLPGYWLVLLVIEFPAIYLTGIIALRQTLRCPELDAERRGLARACAALAVASLTVTWLLADTIGVNNDLAWRAVVPGVMVLMIFTAVGLSRWVAAGVSVRVAAALAAIAVALPQSLYIARENIVGWPSADAAAFAESPAMWTAVQRHAGRADRIANNPRSMSAMTSWPVNISWALLANRPSCFAGFELTLPYVPLPRAQQQAIERQFERVFNGTGSPEDVRDLVERYGCSLILVTADDGAWTHDPFAASGDFRLIETDPSRWRLYRAATKAYAGDVPAGR